MKKQLVLATAVLVSAMAFGQKKEIKKAEKAFAKSDLVEAVAQIKAAEAMIAGADDEIKAQFYAAKGEIMLADGKDGDYEKMKDAADAFMKAKQFDKNNDYADAIKNGVQNTRVALVNSAVKDQNAQNFKMASEKLLLSYEVKKDTSDLYFAAGNAVNAKDYDAALMHYERLLDMGYTGIQEEFRALRIEDNEVVTFASKADRDSEMISGKYTQPTEGMTESAKGDILRSIVLIESSRGNNDKALRIMKDARAENPDDMSLIRAEADMVYRMGDMKRYEALMNEVLASDPTNPELYYNLGVSASANGDNTKAIEYYKKALELKPEYPSAQINIASVILGQEKGIVDEMNGLGMTKADTKKYDVLSEKRNGLYSQALPYLESALASRSDNVELVRTLMNIYSQLSMDGKYNEMKAKLATME
ncbi:hypothetical protein ULMS_18000 [Patiriisocius marinistellae]|uniref:Uncharacterized protein n=1 Tax=Patiriisocius marinistellae TaxID=2494560 RepID=A0A5J4FYI2_9FLAO|nr:tetratricopeptide repeat protein [Patiriisocius marinistellae]GEQ86292.1 hypothetical protein ULMS_18000 [Patiriisocius marinistellae]